MLSRELNRYYEPLRLPLRPAAISFPYTHPVDGLPTAVTGLPCCTIYPPQHATPATPRVVAATSVISATTSGLPLQTRGSASPFSVTRLRPGSLALRPAALPLKNLRHPIAQTPLLSAKKAYGQLLSRDFNPLDIPPITANSLTPLIPTGLPGDHAHRPHRRSRRCAGADQPKGLSRAQHRSQSAP
jgi:hypothetical protein